MRLTSRSDQWEPPSAACGLVQSLMGRKMWVVFLKGGRASRRVVGSGVCMSIKVMEGRRRITWEAGYLGRVSCSRYLFGVGNEVSLSEG